MRRFPLVRATLGVKLALVLFAAVAAALAVVYVMVVPQLDSRVAESRIADLEQAMPSLLRELETTTTFELQDTLSFAAASLNARVVIFQRVGEEDLSSFADSRTARGGDIDAGPVALRSAEAWLRQSGRVTRDGSEYAEVAAPIRGNHVVLVSAPLEDALADVRLIRRSLFVAGLVALLASAVVAYLAAFGLTRRLRRLETAAGRIAAGDFEAPVAATGSDEIAELGRELDAMRVRLADLDRVRREFIANASHELRTPLFSLGGFLELIADEEMDEATRQEFLAETRAQVERLTRLATDLLDLSRLDAGQLSVERGEVDLAIAARTLLDEFRVVADAGGYPISLTAPAAVPAVGDHERVVQIGRALVENALRHTPPGTPIEVSAERAGDRSLLVVRDEGPGIPAEDQGRLFQRFYRAGGGKASGSGLGLAIAAELAVRMGGTLGLESRPGETTFALALSAAGEPAFPRENGEPARELAATRGSGGAGSRP